jgi:hypothetical protein
MRIPWVVTEPEPEREIPLLREAHNEAADTSFVTEVLPLAGAGDARFAPGVGQTIAREECLSLGVRNLGTTNLIVETGPANDRPAGFIGPGAAIVQPGEFAVLAFPEMIHAFYGRPGELVEVTRYPCAQPPHIDVGDGGWFAVDLGTVGVAALIYTTPWGLPCVYGGFSARETSEVGRYRFRIRDGNTVGGPVLETISLAPGESTSDHSTITWCRTASLFLEPVAPNAGTCEMVLRVR